MDINKIKPRIFKNIYYLNDRKRGKNSDRSRAEDVVEGVEEFHNLLAEESPVVAR